MKSPPLLIHCPRGSGPVSKIFFKKVRPHYLEYWERTSGPGIEVITYNNHDHPFPVEIQMRKMGIRYHVLAKNVRPWKFSGKILPVLEFLESGAVTSSLVMLIDGNDTIFTRFPSLEEIKAKLESHKPAEAVFCATPANWPPDNVCKKYESGLYPKPYCHLSTGAYVGSVEAIIKGLKWIRDRMPSRTLNLWNGAFDDQLAWRRAHYAAPFPMSIDYNCLLFKRCGKWLEEAENPTWLMPS